MSDIAITAENVSKSYWVGQRSARRESYTALRDVIAREARNFARKTVDLIRGRQIFVIPSQSAPGRSRRWSCRS